MVSSLETLYKTKIVLALLEKPQQNPNSQTETTLLPQMKTREFCCDLVIPFWLVMTDMDAKY